MAWFAVIVSLLAGAANPFQSAANGQLNKQLGQPVWAAIVTYATGLGGMLLVQLVLRQRLPVDQIAGVNWWAWTGGLISIVSTVAGLLMVQRLGSGIFTALSITTSLAVSVLLDQYGVMGMRHHPATPGRLVGCTLLIAGVWLVSRS